MSSRYEACCVELVPCCLLRVACVRDDLPMIATAVYLRRKKGRWSVVRETASVLRGAIARRNTKHAPRNV